LQHEVSKLKGEIPNKEANDVIRILDQSGVVTPFNKENENPLNLMKLNIPSTKQPSSFAQSPKLPP
jgi:hypothetical protein